MNYLKLLSYAGELLKVVAAAQASPSKKALIEARIDLASKRFTVRVIGPVAE